MHTRFAITKHIEPRFPAEQIVITLLWPQNNASHPRLGTRHGYVDTYLRFEQRATRRILNLNAETAATYDSSCKPFLGLATKF
jgi:hypothetical protein